MKEEKLKISEVTKTRRMLKMMMRKMMRMIMRMMMRRRKRRRRLMGIKKKKQKSHR